jgi:hypothetical protein
MSESATLKKRYYIVSHTAFTARDWDRFGCEDMQAAGYQVCPVVMGRALGVPQAAQQSIEAAAIPATLTSAEAMVAGMRPVDIVVVELRLSPATRPFFRWLTRHGVRYAAVDLGALPGSSAWPASLAEQTRFLVMEARRGITRVRYFLRDVTSHGFEYVRLRPPSLWLTAGTAVSVLTSGLPAIWRATRISVNSFDAMLAERTGRAPSTQQPVAVFLDEAFSDHPDYEIIGVPPPVTSNAYWSAMERLFRALEASTGLRVTIATHPKNAGNVPPSIKRRMAAPGRTAELVRDAQVVICHASTAVSFAVLFRRPMIFASTAEIEHSVYGPAIARMAGWFGLKPVNADHFDPAQLSIASVDAVAYRRYEHAFLRAADASARTPWEILRSEVEGQRDAIDMSRAALATLGDR